MKRILKIIGVLILLLLIAVLGIGLWHYQPYPTLVSNSQEEAKATAHQMLQAINDSAWQNTGAVTWSFRGARKHLWDRERHLARIGWGNYEVFMNLHDQSGQAFKNGQRLSGEAADPALKNAWKVWCNDTFWLNPISKIFDEGSSLHLVEEGEAQKHLLIKYSSGGVTPGDSYLWTIDETGRPSQWDMWVSLVPVPGVKVTWENWKQIETGVWISTLHEFPLGIKLTIDDLRGASTLKELTNGEDPFSILYE